MQLVKDILFSLYQIIKKNIIKSSLIENTQYGLMMIQI